MNKDEARTLLQQVAEELRQKSYAELRDKLLGRIDVREVRGPSGRTYQVEIECWPDSPRGGEDLRVLLAIDDGTWSAFRPLTDSFIVSPNL